MGEPENGTPSVFDLLGDARVRFWSCDCQPRCLVTWTHHDDGTATPRCENCGTEGPRR